MNGQQEINMTAAAGQKKTTATLGQNQTTLNTSHADDRATLHTIYNYLPAGRYKSIDVLVL